MSCRCRENSAFSRSFHDNDKARSWTLRIPRGIILQPAVKRLRNWKVLGEEMNLVQVGNSGCDSFARFVCLQDLTPPAPRHSHSPAPSSSKLTYLTRCCLSARGTTPARVTFGNRNKSHGVGTSDNAAIPSRFGDEPVGGRGQYVEERLAVLSVAQSVLNSVSRGAFSGEV